MDETKLYEAALNVAISKIVGFFSWIGNKVKGKRSPLSDAELKTKIHVLFIDDEDFEYVESIRNAGWNVTQIQDLENLDDERLRRAHIIFLDYVGVGTKLSPNEEGIGLLKAIQNKYPEKIIIFYSAHAGFSLGDEFRTAQDWLIKNSDPYVYLQKIEENARKLNPDDLL